MSQIIKTTDDYGRDTRMLGDQYITTRHKGPMQAYEKTLANVHLQH